MTPTSNVWQSLNTPTLLDQIENILGLKLKNLLIKRNSYINRVFEIERIDTNQALIIKLYRPGRWTPTMIQNELDFIIQLSQTDVSVIPPISFQGKTLFKLEDYCFAIFPKKGGRAVDEFNQQTWEQVGRLLARVHAVGETMTDGERIAWRPAIATKNHLEILEKSDTVVPAFRRAVFDGGAEFIQTVDAQFSTAQSLLIHGDCHRGNLIYRPDEGIFLIDFDDMCIGSAVQDLWMLLPESPEHCPNEMQWFLEGYETFREFPVDELRLIPALRAMRQIHFAAWCALQASEPQFTEHFPEWGGSRYWNELLQDLLQLSHVDD